MSIKNQIPNLFTAGNLVGGILAIIFTLQGNIHIAPLFIFASAILDFLDGFVARALKVQSELGKQLDSLADMVTFGVAPGIIVYQLIRSHYAIEFYAELYTPSNWSFYFPLLPESACGNEDLIGINDTICGSAAFNYLPFIAFIIPVFALYRLAKFNLDTRQSDQFIGLPTPAMTLFFAALPIIVYNGFANGGTEFEIARNYILHPAFLIVSSIVLSILMVVELPLFALKFKHFKWKGNEIRYSFLTIAVGMLAILSFWSLPIIVILYVILSLFTNRKNQSK